MPSKDTFHEKKPELNENLEKDVIVSSEKERRPATGRSVSGTLHRLAKRTGQPVEDLAERIPADTVRRTKYPVTEQVNEDGTRTFKQLPEAIDGPRALVQK